MENKKFRILVVDDEPAYSEVLEMILTSKKYSVETCLNGKEALEKLKNKDFDLVLSDLIMPEMGGLELLEHIKKEHDGVCVIIMTAYATVENAVHAMKLGAYTYVIKGTNPEELLIEIKKIQEMKSLLRENHYMKEKMENKNVMLETNAPAFIKVLKIAKKAAQSNVNILILGESGVGKEVLAKYIHQHSERENNQFMDVNCHAFSDSLLESELFGHEKGAFTGALTRRIGRFEASDGGTLFLDEIGDISLNTQSKLLKVIETKMIYRIGKNEPIPIDFRLITATNKNLEEEIRDGKFREDLFYRLSTIVIEIPPLRKRTEDIKLLIDFFIRKSMVEMKKEIKQVESEAMAFLVAYDYPGNIRELKNLIERLVVLSENKIIRFEDLPAQIMKKRMVESVADEINVEQTLKDIRKGAETKYIKSVLKDTNGNMNESADILGISRRQLFNKIAEYGLK